VSIFLFFSDFVDQCRSYQNDVSAYSPRRGMSSPSPAAAAKGKVSRCYSGPLSSRTVTSMIKCDSHGPLVVHVAKLYAEPDGRSFSAFGRIYSGTVKPGEHFMDICFCLFISLKGYSGTSLNSLIAAAHGRGSRQGSWRSLHARR
jgi:hypothetical protein